MKLGAGCCPSGVLQMFRALNVLELCKHMSYVRSLIRCFGGREAVQMRAFGTAKSRLSEGCLVARSGGGSHSSIGS